MNNPIQPNPGTKKERVLTYLRGHRHVTVREMVLYCHVNNPPAWIGFLEADGWQIDRRSMYVGGCVITVYNLKEV